MFLYCLQTLVNLGLKLSVLFFQWTKNGKKDFKNIEMRKSLLILLASLLLLVMVYLYKTTLREIEEDDKDHKDLNPKFNFEFQFKDLNQDLVL